jgi:hypothetical protein
MVAIRRVRGQPKLKKVKCEICDLLEPRALEIHHVIPRNDPGSHNNNSNLAVLCGSCHNLIHSGEIIVLGIYQSTSGRVIIHHRKNEPPPLEEKFWLIKKNDKVKTR